jgi:hypothetical protein
MEWLRHDYGNGGVVDISAVDAYSGRVSMWIVFGCQIIFKKIQNSQWTDPLTKLNINKSCYVDSIWL